MKIFDVENKRILSNVTVFLTPGEALKLASSIADLGHNPSDQHIHINDEEFNSEITIAVYTPENINMFDEESRTVIGVLKNP
jgi:hypothetical protein